MGEFVLLKPPFAAYTLLLWLAPVVLLAAGLGLIWRTQRRTRPGDHIDPDKLTAAEKKKLARLMSDDRSPH